MYSIYRYICIRISISYITARYVVLLALRSLDSIVDRPCALVFVLIDEVSLLSASEIKPFCPV